MMAVVTSTTQPFKTTVNWFALLVILIMIAIGSSISTYPLLPLASIIPMGFVISVGFIIIELALVWWLMSRSKLWASAGAWPLLAILWGATVPMIFNRAAADPIGDIVAALQWEEAFSAFAGAWPEETSKGLGVVLLLLLLPKVWDKPWHGLHLGMLVGLGFELIENLQYGIYGGFEHGSSDATGVFLSWILRNSFGGGLHLMFSALVGFGIGMALLHPTLSTARRWLVGLAGFGAGFGAHFVWNYDWPPSFTTLVWVVTYLFCLVATVWCWRYSYQLARKWSTPTENLEPTK